MELASYDNVTHDADANEEMTFDLMGRPVVHLRISQAFAAHNSTKLWVKSCLGIHSTTLVRLFVMILVSGGYASGIARGRFHEHWRNNELYGLRALSQLPSMDSGCG
jgi:hypothetical protein